MQVEGVDYRRWVAQQVEVINHALRGIPSEQVRYHVCWGSWPGPHTSDVLFRTIADLILRVNAQGFSIEAANPRHEWEWTVWQDVKLPEGKILIPGVISHAISHVEHPELIAQRLRRFADLVGRENVIASSDCGFAQGAVIQRQVPSIVWAKLSALAEGAQLASRQLDGSSIDQCGLGWLVRATGRGTLTVRVLRGTRGPSSSGCGVEIPPRRQRWHRSSVSAHMRSSKTCWTMWMR